MEPAEIIETAAGCLNPTERDDRTSGGEAAAIITSAGAAASSCIQIDRRNLSAEVVLGADRVTTLGGELLPAREAQPA